MNTVFAAGLWESIFSGFFPVVLVLLGLLGLVFGIVSVYQTRRWPRAPKPKAKTESKPTVSAPANPTPPVTGVLRPTTTTKRIQIGFPEIASRHPDVWGTDTPLAVQVRVDRGQHAPEAELAVRLSTHRKSVTTTIGTATVDAAGVATFRVPLDGRGEQDLVAELLVNDTASGQAVRSIRTVDYRGEIVETFDDFVAWAASHYPNVDRKLTAREFIDRYADGRPGTPIAPLERIVDLYELANYSEHPVDRGAYLDLVDAFLELESAGALEGPGEK